MTYTARRGLLSLVTVGVCFGLARTIPDIRFALGATSLASGTKTTGVSTSSSVSALPGATSPSTSRFQLTPVATLRAQDFKDYDIHDFAQPVGFLPDGHSLEVFVTEIGGSLLNDPNSALLSGVGRYEAVNLQDGSVKSLARTRNDFGLDFSFGPPGSQVGRRVKSTPARTDGPRPWLKFSPSTNTAPPKDVVQSFTPTGLTGRAVSMGMVPLSGTGNNTKWGTFVTLRRFGKEVSTIQTFPVSVRDGSDTALFGWSPDGRRIMFGVGAMGDSTDTFLIYLWNPATGVIEQGPKEKMSFGHPRWSPDSARIGYIVGGDVNGQNGFLAKVPTSLRVYDVATGKSRVLKTTASGPVVSLGQFQWQNANSLLYATYVLPDSIAKAQSKAARQQAVSALKPDDIHPSLFEVAATGGASKLVAKDAFLPMPSPDGQWIAFFGWPDAKDATAEAKTNPQSRYFGPRLFLWERKTKQRTLVSPNIFSSNIQMMWTPDSQKLALLKSTYDSKKAQGTVQIGTIAVQ